MLEDLFEDLFSPEELDRPLCCSKCGGSLKYEGLGEYVCNKCEYIERDSYGKVRTYLETHGGASVYETSLATGVSRNVIKRMLKESRFSLSNAKTGFLKCESCGKGITTGRLCEACERDANATQNKSGATSRSTSKGVYIGNKSSDDGQFRYVDRNKA